MNRQSRALRAILVVLLIGAAAGCGYAERREAESVVSQELQLEAFGLQIEEWGEGILAQIPEDEIEHVTEVRGADPRRLSDDFDLWPQYQAWDVIVRLNREGARTPLQMADDLEPWLIREGWERSDGGRDDVAKTYVRKSYWRDGYRLSVRAVTEAPPYAQRLTFGITSPPTKP